MFFNKLSPQTRLFQGIFFLLCLNTTLLNYPIAGHGRAFLLNGKRVCLIGDTHHCERGEEYRFLCDVIAALKETQESSPGEKLLILFEKAGLGLAHPLRREPDPQEIGDPRVGELHHNILSSLDLYIKANNIPNVEIEDAEIRLNTASIGTLLSSSRDEHINLFDLWNYRFWQLKNMKHFEHGPVIGEITFQHLIDDYLRLSPIFKEFQEQHTQLKESNFNADLIDMGFEYRDFVNFLKEQNISPQESIYDRFEALENNADKQELALEALRITENFINAQYKFLDMHLLKKIIEHKGDHIVIIAGKNHCMSLESYFVALEAEYKVVFNIPKTRYHSEEFSVPLIPQRALSKDELVWVLSGRDFWENAEYKIQSSLNKAFITSHAFCNELFETLQQESHKILSKILTN